MAITNHESARRACLLAAFDPQNIIADYVVYLVKELSKFADVYYYADNNMADSEFAKLKGLTKYAKGAKHGHYDFGSWAFIIKDIGYEKLAGYDELLLVNDAMFGPMSPLGPVFEEMEAKNVDAWALCGNKFMMSFFINLKKSVFTHPDFKYFFDNIKAEGDKSVVIKKYEQGLSRLVKDNGFSSAVYIDGKAAKAFYKKNRKEVWRQIKAVVPFWARPFIKKISPDKVRLYDDDFILPLMMKMPVLKKASLLMGNGILGGFYPYFVKENSDYPVELIGNYFKRLAVTPPSLRESIKNRFKIGIKNFIIRKKYKKGKVITYILKIPVWHKKMNYKI